MAGKLAGAVLLLVGSGCAQGTHVVSERVMLGYTDERLFAVQHRDAAVPDPGPSAGLYEYAGVVYGRACGADVNLFAHYRGSAMTLDGVAKYLDVRGLSVAGDAMEKPAYLEIRDRWVRGELVRTIDGHIGSEDLPEMNGADSGSAAPGSVAQLAARLAATPRHHQVELRMTHDAVSGSVGFRTFALHAVGDSYEGVMTFGGVPVPFRLRGRGSLWSMPSADQAAILPFVMTCIVDDRRLVQEVSVIYRR